jgi:hypothetical protein
MLQRQASLFQYPFEVVGLGDCPRKTVENKSRLAIRLFQPFGDELDHDVVRDKIAAREIAGSLLPERCFGARRLAQNVSRRNLARAELLLQKLGLCSLTGPRRTKKNDAQNVHSR